MLCVPFISVIIIEFIISRQVINVRWIIPNAMLNNLYSSIETSLWKEDRVEELDFELIIFFICV